MRHSFSTRRACVFTCVFAGSCFGGALERDCNTFGGRADAIMIMRQSEATRAEADSKIFKILVGSQASLTTDDDKTAYALITKAYEIRVEETRPDQDAAVAAFGQWAARICQNRHKSNGGSLP